MATRIMKCKCDHKFQDRVYGRGMRVHNSTHKDNKSGWRCTVCENEKGDN